MTISRVSALIVLSLTLCSLSLRAQTVTSFDGIAASQVAKPEFDVDPNGAVGTKQFMEYVNLYYQAYDKNTFVPVWSSPQAVSSPFTKNGLTTCEAISGNGTIIFDRLASRWVIAGHTGTQNNYYYCVAVSSTDDLSSSSLTWYTYQIALNSILGKNAAGNVYFPDWPKIATWPDAYYVAIDLNDVNSSYAEVGVVACALDRTNMLINGTPNSPQCFRETSPLSNGIYLAHSLIPADVDGTVPPPAGRHQYMVSIENPVIDNATTTSGTFNLWDFHVDWANPSLSTFSASPVSVAPYTPGCYAVHSPAQTVCVPEPSTSVTGEYIDSVGDRFMPRLAYRNFGSYESFLFSHDVQVASNRQTGIRWYELRGSDTPFVYQDGTVSPDSVLYRFTPSIAEDSSGNAAAGYSVSSSTTHPGLDASWWSLTNPTAPVEITLYSGNADQENTWHWGSYNSMTVDPVDGCTFWYVNEYYPQNQTGLLINWHTRIANFKVPGCGTVSLSPASMTFNTQVVGTTSAAQVATLTNSQSATLNLSIGFTGSSSGDFAQTNTCGASLAAGASCTISVTFDPAAAGSRTASLNVTDNAATSPQTISLSGTGVAPVTLSATSLSFGTVLVGTSVTAPAVILTNHQLVALTNINVAVTGTSFSQTNTCGTSIAAAAQCAISITFSPTVAGLQTGTVTITDSASNSPQTISLRGSGLLPVTLSPAPLNFGTQTVGTTSAPQTETLTNNQKVTLNITGITIAGTNSSDFTQTGTTCSSSLSAGGKCTITLTFTPSATGTRTAWLRVTDSASTSPQNAKLTGTGQ